MNRAALLWGFAEATLFFLVPDVLLIWIAVQRTRREALVACAFALGGAHRTVIRHLKIYAVNAGKLGLSLVFFFVISVPGRLLRFVVTVLLASAISDRLLKTWPVQRKLYVLVAYWVVFYAAFWWWMPAGRRQGPLPSCSGLTG